MDSIIATIKSGDTGAQVANLQDALLLLLEHGSIRALDAPNRPTLQDLRTLTDGVNQGRKQSQFNDATVRLVEYFQVQQGLGDALRGIVETATATKINELLTALGAIENAKSRHSVVRDRTLK